MNLRYKLFMKNLIFSSRAADLRKRAQAAIMAVTVISGEIDLRIDDLREQGFHAADVKIHYPGALVLAL